MNLLLSWLPLCIAIVTTHHLCYILFRIQLPFDLPYYSMACLLFYISIADICCNAYTGDDSRLTGQKIIDILLVGIKH
ncbi:hypothetical protein CPB84DRAFT_1758450 [Gymnopilus junonius]|uniref:Uncharacterized protein n=1 Tax=Gymnopilus junonius TaxID=109634 RepID=A0A9P5TV77_GYMJU|nr:hypothetical protein CPB84DRAFT_1758450 [Gymnopilus junonius]